MKEHELVQLKNPVTKKWTLIDITDAKLLAFSDTKYKGVQTAAEQEANEPVRVKDNKILLNLNTLIDRPYLADIGILGHHYLINRKGSQLTISVEEGE